jgi:flagellar basal body rod protein FlgB
MLRGLFGPSALTSMLRGGLEETSATHRVIADRVANALDSSSATSFSDELKAKQGKAAVTEADLQRDMASLADTQLRYEADAKLLKEAYTRLREAIRGRNA